MNLTQLFIKANFQNKFKKKANINNIWKNLSNKAILHFSMKCDIKI